MSDFVSFVRAHGIRIEHLPTPGRWHRLPTEDHPRKRNGAVKFMGDHGFVQNHATMTEVAVWRGEKVDGKQVAQIARQASKDIAAGQAKAAEKAEWILGQCALEKHPYLEKKGFPDHMANVWQRDDARLLAIPMRVGRRIAGCQLIDESGQKKFLTGQRTSDAAFVFDAKGPNVLCEGYATALSIQASLAALKRSYTLFVCFSAHNMTRIAKTLAPGLVVADNDASGTGERAAKEIGWPYFMPPTVGQDFNDFHQSTSLFKASQALRTAMT